MWPPSRSPGLPEPLPRFLHFSPRDSVHTPLSGGGLCGGTGGAGTSCPSVLLTSLPPRLVEESSSDLEFYFRIHVTDVRMKNLPKWFCPSGS